MQIEFNCHGNDKQKECASYWINNSVADIVYGGSKGSGKSYLGCSLIFGDALIYPNTHYFIARKKLNDLRKYTIPSIHEVFEDWGLSSAYFKYNGQDNMFTLYNGSKVFLLEAKYLPSDPQYMRFGSMQMTRGWIEEAGEFEEDAKNNLHASIGRWKNDEYGLKGKLLQTCNPSKNYLYREYYKKSKSNELDNWRRFIQALPQDNKKLDSGYLEHLERTLSKNEKKRLLQGDWEYDDDPNALCDYDSIVSIFENDHVKKSDKYITCDVARFGSDKARVGVWEGWRLIEKHSFDLSKTTEIQLCINTMRKKHHISKDRCIADEDGVGGGVVDNCGIKGFTNNAKALPENGKDVNYRNLQTQCLYHLAEIINDREIFIECDVTDREKEEIIEELEQIKAKNKEINKLDVISKDEVKSNIGRSPDWRDLFLMRYYFELKVKPKLRHSNSF